MSKKQSRTKRPQARVNLPALTDPLLTALLMYIGNDSNARTFVAADTVAQRMLTSQPITTAFEMYIDRPVVYEEIAEALRARMQDWTEPAASMRSLDAMEAARRDDSRASVAWRDVNSTLDSYIDTAMLAGACLMYRLLNGGGRDGQVSFRNFTEEDRLFVQHVIHSILSAPALPKVDRRRKAAH